MAELERWVRLRRRGKANLVDAAIAKVSDTIDLSIATIRGRSPLSGLADEFVPIGTSVWKLGRTTGLRRGRVRAFDVDNLIVSFDAGDLRFNGQLEIEAAGDSPFSDGGDSGSLIVNADSEAMALLFAGTDSGGRKNLGLTFANPIHTVLRELKVDLAYT